MEMFDVLIEALQIARDRLQSENGSVVPTVVVWAAVFVLLATGWSL